MKRLLIFCSLIFLSSTLLEAQITTFTGGDPTNPNKWNEGNNWDTGIVPLSGDTVSIDGDSVSITTVSPELYSLELKNGASLLNRQQLTFNNADTFGIRLVGSTIRNEGDILVNEAGSDYSSDRAIEIFSGSKLINDSLIHVENLNGAGIYVITSELVNNGTISVSARGIAISDHGQIFNQDSMYLRSVLLNPLRIASSGEFNNSASGIVHGIVGHNTGLYSQGDISNFGKISVTSGQRPLFLRSNSSFLHQSGLVALVSTGDSGSISSLTIETNANMDMSTGSNLELSSPDGHHYIDVETGGIFDCRGVIETME